MQTIPDLLAAGDIAYKAGRAQAAKAAYGEVLDVDPNQSLAQRRLAWIEDHLGNPAKAAELLRRLIALLPADAQAHQDLALCLRKLGSATEALAELRLATQVDPSYAPAFCNLGLALEDAGDLAEAVAALRKAAVLRPESAFIAFHLAAVGGAAPPAICPPDYLVNLFDDYADRFDTHLFQTLAYQGPALLKQIVANHGRPKPWDIMDLGCGTGMTGVPFRADARHITGVDLSPRMLQHAGGRSVAPGRRVYDRLVQLDIVAALRQYRESFDLILAADVFIFVGDIGPTFAAAQAALRPGGLMAFTTESHPGPGDFALCPTRRYAHTPEYVTRLADGLGFILPDRRDSALRRGDDGKPVAGKVFLLRKPGE